MTADQTNQETTDKKKASWKSLLWKALKGFLIFVLVFFLLFMAYWAWLARDVITSGFNDYCYLLGLHESDEDDYKRRIEWEKSSKLPGWEEEVKTLEKEMSESDPRYDTFISSVMMTLCGDLEQYKTPKLFTLEDIGALEEPANE